MCCVKLKRLDEAIEWCDEGLSVRKLTAPLCCGCSPMAWCVFPCGLVCVPLWPGVCSPVAWCVFPYGLVCLCGVTFRTCVLNGLSTPAGDQFAYVCMGLYLNPARYLPMMQHSQTSAAQQAKRRWVGLTSATVCNPSQICSIETF